MIKNIPTKVNQANLYHFGLPMGTSGEIQLPELSEAPEELSGAGILGTLDDPAVGNFESMEQEIPIAMLEMGIAPLMNPLIAHEVTLRASCQQADRMGNVSFYPLKAVFRGRKKKLAQGTVQNGKPMDASITLELSYYKLEISKVPIVEIDKLNNIYRVAGRDVLAIVKAQS